MKKRLLKSLCALLALPVLLTGCWQEELPEQNTGLTQPGEEAPAEPRSILPAAFSLPYAPDRTLDPVTCADGMQQVVGSLLYEGLFRLDGQLEPQPLLCSDYTYDPVAYTYVFTLRPGVTFSDGSPLTGADAAATLDRARTSDRYRERLAQVAAVSVGEGAVTVTLSGPNAAFPALLDIPIVKAGTEDDPAPLGTGPYRLETREGGAVLTGSAGWWQGDPLPVETIGLVEAADREAMLYRFTSHDVQLITADLIGTDPIGATGNVSYQDAATTTLQFIGVNAQRPPLDDPAVRRLLGAGINRTSVVGAFLSGHAAAAQFPVSPVSPLYPADLEDRYSLDAFTAALSASGYAAERPLTLLVNEENPFKVSVAEHIASGLTAGGVAVETRVLPWADYAAALAAGNFDLYYGEVKLTADWDLTRLLSTGGALNYGGWSDPRTDQLLANCASATDRAAAIRALCAHLKDQAPLLPVCFKSTSVLMQADVLEGLSPTMAEPFYDLAACTIHLRED